MNKKLNTVFFLIGATLFNLLVMFLLILVLLKLAAVIFFDSPPTALLPVLLLLAMGGSFFIYHRVLKILARKVDLDKYFLPLFKKKR